MEYTYIQYAEFERRVIAMVGPGHYNDDKYQLPHIGLLFRERFLESLELCGDISRSVYVLDKCKALPDKHYRRFLSYICQKGINCI